MSHSPSPSDDHHAPTPALDLLRASLSTPRERERFDGLLALLEVPADEARTSRIEATNSVVSAARDADRAARVGHASPLPADVAKRVDAWVEGNTDEPVERFAALLDLPADPSREDRIARTLDLVQRDMDHQSDRLRLDPVQDAADTRRRFRLSDLGAIAAVLTIVAAIGVPALTNLQHNTWAAQSTANLQQAGFASSLFSYDNDSKIPHTRRQSTKYDAPQWWNVGDANQSHSAHLFSLISGGYLTYETLNAPGNHDAPASSEELGAADWQSFDQVSYSYRLFDDAPRITDLQRTVLLADRSPVIRQAIEQGAIDPLTNSDNHRGKGQHVVFGDSSVVFLSSPRMPNGDNLWLPRSAEESGRLSLRGDERPADPTDQFVGP